MSNVKMKLVLPDGSCFEGVSATASSRAVGELVFNTSMVGWQEVISDPAYLGQIVVMTYPIIGQSGIIEEDFESRSNSISALVVGELCDSPSNFRCGKTLPKYLEEKGIPCLEGVDTRAITRMLSRKGTLVAALVGEDTSVEEALDLIRNYEYPTDGFAPASCSKRWFSRTPNHLYDVVAVDFGIKRRLIDELNARSCNVTVVPFNTSFEDIVSFSPDGIIYSNGPGDPSSLSSMLPAINAMKGKFPIWGVGLGHQLLGLSYGIDIVDLGCGYHGDCAVRDCGSGRIFTASHNNRFALPAADFEGSKLKVTFSNVLSGVVEGFESEEDSLFTCQFNPEGGPGPEESGLFDKFIKMMEERRNA